MDENAELTPPVGATLVQQPIRTKRFLKLPAVLERVPYGRSTWWAGIEDGRFPAPVRLGPKSVAWREEDIDRVMEQIEAGTLPPPKAKAKNVSPR